MTIFKVGAIGWTVYQRVWVEVLDDCDSCELLFVLIFFLDLGSFPFASPATRSFRNAFPFVV